MQARFAATILLAGPGLRTRSIVGGVGCLRVRCVDCGSHRLQRLPGKARRPPSARLVVGRRLIMIVPSRWELGSPGRGKTQDGCIQQERLVGWASRGLASGIPTMPWPLFRPGRPCASTCRAQRAWLDCSPGLGPLLQGPAIGRAARWTKLGLSLANDNGLNAGSRPATS